MHLIAGPGFAEFRFYRWAVHVINNILCSESALAEIYLPVFKLFPEGDTLTAKILLNVVSAVGSIHLSVHRGSDAPHVSMVAFPTVDVPYIAVSPYYHMAATTACHTARFNVQLEIFVSLIHEVAHLLTPLVARKLGLPDLFSAPLHIGHFVLPQYADQHSGGDCGYGVETNLFGGGVLSVSNYAAVDLMMLKNPSGLVEPTNMMKKVLPPENVAQIIAGIDRWAKPAKDATWRQSRRGVFRWFSRVWARPETPFPIQLFRLLADYHKLDDLPLPAVIPQPVLPPPSVFPFSAPKTIEDGDACDTPRSPRSPRSPRPPCPRSPMESEHPGAARPPDGPPMFLTYEGIRATIMPGAKV